MKNLTKEMLQVVMFNLRNIVIFELVYRLITLPLYLRMVDQGVKFALKMAGYSYLTVGNIGSFLTRPWTIACILTVGTVGLLFLLLEIGTLITMFQCAAYYKKIGFWEGMAGGISKLTDEIRRRNISLLLLTLIDYVLTNLYLIYRVFTHVKPLNFVMAEMMRQPAAKVLLFIAVAAFICAAVPGLYTFHGCMVEQKNFWDGYRRSRKLIKGQRIRTCLLLTGYNIFVVAGLLILYGICVAAAAVFVTASTDRSLALAVLLEACGKIELALIFLTSMILTVADLAAVTVQYYQYSQCLNHEPRWDFAFPKGKARSRKALAVIVACVTGLSLFAIFDLVRNGSNLSEDVLQTVQITAHRGSSKTAPENTMAALRAAVEERADFAEIDVQETADGVVVLCHDRNLKRVAGVGKTVDALTSDSLEKLEVGSWFSPEYAGEKIPALEEVMKFCKGQLNLNIEIKDMGKGSALPRKVTGFIEEMGMEEQCVVSSTNLSYLREIKELDPEIRTGYIISAAYGNYYSNESIDFISLRSSFVNERLVTGAHEAGKAVHAWTVNSKSEMERMKLLGVDNIITDYPILAREIVYRTEATENLLEYIRLVFK